MKVIIILLVFVVCSYAQIDVTYFYVYDSVCVERGHLLSKPEYIENNEIFWIDFPDSTIKVVIKEGHQMGRCVRCKQWISYMNAFVDADTTLIWRRK